MVAALMTVAIFGLAEKYLRYGTINLAYRKTESKGFDSL